MAYCGHCGIQVKDGLNFCTKCGNPIEDKALSEAVSASEGSNIDSEKMSDHKVKAVTTAPDSLLGFVTKNVEISSIVAMMIACAIGFFMKNPLLSTSIGVLIMLLSYILLLHHRKYGRLTIFVIFLAIMLIFSGVDLQRSFL